MLEKELPLVFFTLLGQAAGGLFLAGLLAREYLTRRLPASEALAETRRAMHWSLGLLIVAALVSFVHLGSPLGAFRAANNVMHSALAQEIVALGAFGALLVASVALDYRGWPQPLSRIVGWLTAAAGLVLVLAMSRIYQSTIIPAWTSSFTPVSFVAAYLVLGGGLLLLTLPRAATSVVGIAAAAGLLGVVSQVVALPFYLAELGGGSAFARQALTVLTGDMVLTLGASVVLLLLAAAVMALLWVRHTLAPRLVYLAVFLAIAGELAARAAFYGSAVPIRVG
ncbi:MAG: dimethyl sulfoxide reductase anchor subunit [Chloroflexi bacterium]|nr:dimethyl sulfoxide reductase anchor subunit [Chloroflexota bacterium]